MDAVVAEAIWTATWLAVGICIGAVGMWSVLANRVDARARNLSETAHKVATINPRATMTPEAAYTAAMNAAQPVSDDPFK